MSIKTIFNKRDALYPPDMFDGLSIGNGHLVSKSSKETVFPPPSLARRLASVPKAAGPSTGVRQGAYSSSLRYPQIRQMPPALQCFEAGRCRWSLFHRESPIARGRAGSAAVHGGIADRLTTWSRRAMDGAVISCPGPGAEGQAMRTPPVRPGRPARWPRSNAPAR